MDSAASLSSLSESLSLESLSLLDSPESLEESLAGFSFFLACSFPAGFSALLGADSVLLRPGRPDFAVGPFPPKLCWISSRRSFICFSFAESCSLAGVLEVSSTSLRPRPSFAVFFRQLATYFSSSRNVDALRVSKSISISSGFVSRSEGSRD